RGAAYDSTAKTATKGSGALAGPELYAACGAFTCSRKSRAFAADRLLCTTRRRFPRNRCRSTREEFSNTTPEPRCQRHRDRAFRLMCAPGLTSVHRFHARLPKPAV